MNPISLASGILPEATLLETITAAVEAKYDYVGLWIEPDKLSPQDVKDARALLVRSEMPVLDVEVIWLQPGPPDPAHLKTLDIGLELGGKHALVVSSDPNEEGTAEKLAALCSHVDGEGMTIMLECGVFTQIKSYAQGTAILEKVPHENKGILVDPIHVDRMGLSAADIAALPQAWLPYAQFCDAVKPGPDPENFEAIIEDAVDKRKQLGEGDLPISEMLRALPKATPLSIELRSKELRDAYADLSERAKAVALKTRRWLEHHS